MSARLAALSRYTVTGSLAKGLLLDPADMSTMWQDSAKTVPVTAPGDPVRVIKDLSGNGYQAVALADNRRPLLQTDGYRYWLEFDGADDYMTFPNVVDRDFVVSIGYRQRPGDSGFRGIILSDYRERAYLPSGSAQAFFCAGGSVSLGGLAVDTDYTLSGYRRNSNGIGAYKNGALAGTANSDNGVHYGAGAIAAYVNNQAGDGVNQISKIRFYGMGVISRSDQLDDDRLAMEAFVNERMAERPPLSAGAAMLMAR
ncbi:hypothetical protein [Salinisphaera sp. T31B1]|uniref:hypothetical protein n=1 Tax=Salinisphaera sp. T31B1 TaxID=727963 RepID=UPI00333F48B4